MIYILTALATLWIGLVLFLLAGFKDDVAWVGAIGFMLFTVGSVLFLKNRERR